jgi:predicted DNA-binding protein (MmcQ/YjbR family)
MHNSRVWDLEDDEIVRTSHPRKKRIWIHGGIVSAEVPMDPTTAAEVIRIYALGLPGTHEDFPWGESVYKVDGKVFVFAGSGSELKDRLSFSVKLKQTAVDALQTPGATPTGYGLGRHGWVSFRFVAGAVPSKDVLLAWVDESYRSVAKKRRIKELDV